jgi:hypothetical protein
MADAATPAQPQTTTTPAPTTEPTVNDSGFTPEEQAQFDSMRSSDAPAVAPAAPAPAEPAAPADGAAAAKPGDPATPAAADADADDDADDDAAAPAAKPGEKAPKRVSFHKFQRVTTKLSKDLESERAARQQDAIKYAKLEERQNLILEALNTPKQQQRQEEQDPRPDPEKDIFAYVQWLERRGSKLEEQLAGQREETQVSAQERQVADTYVADARQFAQVEPNFVKGYEFLIGNRRAELAMVFFGKDMTDPKFGTDANNAALAPLTRDEVLRINKAISDEEREVVAGALQAGQSPAARIYAIARARGFRPPATAPANGQGQNGQQQPAQGQTQPAQSGNGQAAPAQAPNVAAELARVRQGQDAALSLSAGGGIPATPLTPERLVNMPQHEFEALMDSLTPAQQRAMMGGA